MAEYNKAWTSGWVSDVLGDGATPDTTGRRSVERSGSKTSAMEVKFACGCTVDDIRGQWQACEKPLHQLLADEPYHSNQTRSFLRARELFHVILREAWNRNGPEWPTRKAEIREEYGVMPETFQLDHDLTDRPIVNVLGELEAQLETTPGCRVLHLYNGGSGYRPKIILQIMIDRTPEPLWRELQDLSPAEAISVAFGH